MVALFGWQNHVTLGGTMISAGSIQPSMEQFNAQYGPASPKRNTVAVRLRQRNRAAAPRQREAQERRILRALSR